MVNKIDRLSPPFEWMTEKKMQFMMNSFFFICALLLSRAIFFEAAVPFFISFWAVVQARFSSYKKVVFIGGIIGALTLNFGQAIILVLQWGVYEGIRRFRYAKLPTPLTVAIAVISVQYVWQCIMHGGMPPMLVQLYIGYEVVLSLIMTIFMQLFLKPMPQFLSSNWSYERIGAALFILGAALTGASQLVFSYFSIAIFLLHLTICVVAVVGNMASVILVATVVSTVMNIAQLSFTGMLVVYTLTGILVGASSGLPKYVIAAISVVPSIFFFLYDATLPLDSVYFVSMLIAVTVFLLLPKSVLQPLHRYFHPQDEDVLWQRQQWMTTNMLANLQQFRQFVVFMKELMLDRFTTQEEYKAKVIQPYAACNNCFRYERCWGEQNNGVAETIQHWFLYKSSNKEREALQVEEQLRMKCIKIAKLKEELEHHLYSERMGHQFFHGKKMIALQLRDLSQHIDQLMLDLTEETVSFQTQEEQIIERLHHLNVLCFQVDFISTKAGAYKIICSIEKRKDDGERLVGERIIVPTLSELFQEPFYVEDVVEQTLPFPHVQLTLHSAVRFELAYNIYQQSKSGMLVSGDAHAVFQLHAGLVGVILSDGMGNGRRAKKESMRLIQLMRDYLSYDLNPETAMHTLHYVMSLKQDTDIYATVDFALIDLQYGKLWSWKAGSMSTYILRGEQVLHVESVAAPVGFMPNYSIETQHISLLANDTIIMMSDGIFSSAASWYEQEMYLLMLLRKYARQKISLAAILYEVLDEYKVKYELSDDCTVIVMTVNHIKTKWAVYTPEETLMKR